MRVAYVSMDPGVPVFGRKGCSIHVQEVIRAFLRLGVHIDLFAQCVGGDQPDDLDRVRLHAFPAYSKLDPNHRELSAIAANENLHESLERLGPFDLIYERYSLWSFAAMQWACQRELASVLEVNAPLIEEQAAHRSLIDRAKAGEIASRAFASATTIVAVSQEIARYVESFPATRGSVHLIPNGVNARRFGRQIKPALPAPDVLTIGFVGTLKPWHGLSTLVDAFALLRSKHANVRLLIVGDGPERESLVANLAARGLQEAAYFTGAVDPNEIPALLQSTDVAVAPYDDVSGFYFSPLKVFEYMAAGLPIVASAAGQLESIIHHDETGLLCEPGNARSLADNIAKLMAQHSLRRKLGRNARRYVLAHHTWDSVVRRTLNAAFPSPVQANLEVAV
jgi:glycosyltransferase involved in cell wall biosynthesis